MELQVLEGPEDVTYVGLVGRLDMAGANAIDMEFARRTTEPRKAAVVDMSGTEFLASIGMRMLVSSAKALHRHGCRLVLLGPRDLVRDAIQMAGLDEILPVADDEEQAFQLARATA